MHPTFRHYDPASGQVFHEQQIPAPKWRHRSDQNEWHRVSTPRVRRASQPSGLRNLKTMTLDVLCKHIGSIDEDTLQHVPGHLLWDIWKQAHVRLRIVPLQAWKGFIKALPEEERPEKSEHSKYWNYQNDVEEATATFDTYIKPLQSPTCDFLVHLKIAESVSFSANELFVLPTMKNLDTLEIIQPQDDQGAAVFPRVNDNLVREWSRMDNAFPRLRMLLIWGKDSVTWRSLDYVKIFPSLDIFNVVGRRRDWQLEDAEHPEWIQLASPSHEFNMDSKGPNLPFASITLGRDRNTHTRGEERWTFHRAIVKQPAQSKVAATKLKKRSSKDVESSRRSKRSRLQTVDTLLSQFTAE